MADADREGPEKAGVPPTSDPRRLLGQTISGRYRIDELIGEGGMGAVYRAEHTHMRKRLAIKVLHPAMLGMAEAVERFEREAIAGAHIEHPNVAAATDFGKLEDGSHFLVLEFLEGEDLRSVISEGPLPPERALRIARQVALALRAAHELGIVHRDLKPENVMLLQKEREGDVVKVLDFGIAKVPVDGLTSRTASPKPPLTRLGMAYGTPEYMAPEQALGEEIDGRADLYALGGILYEMLTGRRVFESRGSRSQLVSQVMGKPPPSFAERAPALSIPASLEAVTRRLLEKTASARYRDADELISALDEVAQEMGIAPVVRMSFADRAESFRAAMTTPAAFPITETRASRASRGEGGPTLPEISPKAPIEVAPPSRVPATKRAASSGKTRVPLPAVLAALGIVAVTAAVSGALALQTPDAIRSLEIAEAAANDASVEVLPLPASSSAPSAKSTTSLTPAGPSASPVSSSRASKPELDDARAKGLAALGALAQRYPTDPAVLKALLLAHAADKSGYPAAVGLARRMFEVDPTTVTDPDVKQILFMAANGTPEVATAALDTMGNDMGSHGPDLLFELILAPSVGKFPREHATQLLLSPDVQKKETPALLIAFDLHAATGCKRKALFARARDEGDGRALTFLTPLVPTSGCGLILHRDCYSCLGSRADLRAAIQAIEKRLEKR